MNPYAKHRILESGELEIKLGRRTCVRVEPWSRGLGLQSVTGKHSRSAWFSYLNLLVPEVEEAGDPAVRDFLQDIPTDIQDIARRYPGFGQLSLLHWAARWPAARDLFFSNPALLWLLVVVTYDYNLKMPEVQLLLSQKQRCLLGRLLCVNQASGSQLNLLRKVDFEEAGLREARVFREALVSPTILPLVRHQRRVPVSLLCLLLKYPELASAPLVEELARLAPKTNCMEVLNGLKHMNRAVASEVESIAAVLAGAQPNNRSALAIEDTADPIQCMEQQARARRLQPVVLKGGPLGQGMFEFPPPPLPDDPCIRAIRSAAELEAESVAMSHCVRNYRFAVLLGERYFYKVLSPQRATLELILEADGNHRLGDCKLHRNGTPGKETMAYIRRWFAGCCTR